MAESFIAMSWTPSLHRQYLPSFMNQINFKNSRWFDPSSFKFFHLWAHSFTWGLFFFLELGSRVGSTVNVWFTFAKCLCLLIRPRGAYSTTPILIGKNELKRWILCKTNKLWLIDHGKVSDSCKKRYRELILVSSFCLWVNVHPPLLMILFGCYREV